MADSESVLMATVALVVVLGVFLPLVIWASRYKRIPPNRAMVVYGRRFDQGRRFKVYSGGGVWIRPVIETCEFLSLEPFLVEREVERVVADVRSPKPALVRVRVRAMARISDDVDLLQNAASNLLHKPEDELRRLVAATLEGHTRGVVATEPWGMSDQVLAEKIGKAAAEDLAKIGLEFVGEVFVEQKDLLEDSPGGLVPSLVREELDALKLRVRMIEEQLAGRR